MAKFTVEYNIHIGDKVSFIRHGDGYSDIQVGVVQDISQIPDIFVEGFRNEDGEYTRWKVGIDSLTWMYSEKEKYGESWKVDFETDENVEFVHKGEVGTPEFAEIEYTSLKDFIKKAMEE